MSEFPIHIFIGNIIHCYKAFSVDVIEDSFIAVQDSKIKEVGKKSRLDAFREKYSEITIKEIVLNQWQILIPGFIDTHIHAAQYCNIGIGLNKPLLQWLDGSACALEKQFWDIEFAKKSYNAVVEKTLSHGTTTASYNETIHTDASLILADIAIKYGQRAFIGKSNITETTVGCETESSVTTIEETERFVNEMLNKNSTLVQPIISPSHTFRVSMDVLKELSNLAKKHDLPIQIHMGESKGECEKAIEMYKKSYSEVLLEAGLLTSKTIVAHAIHIPSEELIELAKYKISVSHCPGSNFNLLSGICDVGALTKVGINVGLGSDISAGSNVGIVDQMRNAIIASSALYFQRDNYIPINFVDAFYLATLGGAKALSIDNVVGNFEVGKDFDALVVDMNVENGNSVCLLQYDPLELLEKFVYLGDDRNIVSVFVAGRQVKC